MNKQIHEKALGFERASEAYERGRPDYPQQAIDFLIHTLKIDPSSTIIDLGAGTGKFTRLLFASGARIIALEPIDGMRKKLTALYPDVEALYGVAESIPVDNASADVVVSAQAFHWFNYEKAVSEIHRVLKPKGRLGLIWNIRDESEAWAVELSKIIQPYRNGTPSYTSMKWKQAFDKTSLFTPLKSKEFIYVQTGRVETIVDRVGSISFISALPEEKKNAVFEQVRDLIQNHPDTKGKIEIQIRYQTNVYWCEKNEINLS